MQYWCCFVHLHASKIAVATVFMSLGGFWLQFPGHRVCFVFRMDQISGPGRERRNVFLLVFPVLPAWYAASSPAMHYSSWRDWEQSYCEPCVPDLDRSKEQRLHLHTNPMAWAPLRWSSMKFWCSNEWFEFKKQFLSSRGAFPTQWLLHNMQGRREGALDPPEILEN